MPCVHEFTLVPSSASKFDYDRLKKQPLVEIHDDLLMYMRDSILWLNTLNAGRKRERVEGLCWYGQTLIPAAAIAHFKSIIGAWRNLFSLGPTELQLCGGYISVEGEEDSGQYEKLTYDRDSILKEFDRLTAFCEEVAKSDGTKNLLHMGI